MKFKHNWEFETEKEIENIFTKGNKKLSNLIVDLALSNLKTKINKIHVVSIYAKDVDLIYEIIIDRKDLAITLEQNLNVMENYEDYVRCQKIVEAIKYLK